MRTNQIIESLLRNALKIGTIGGLILGTLAGLPLIIIGAIPGALVGGTMGLIQGFINGLIIAVLSRCFFYPLTRPNLYRLMLGLICTPIGSVGTFFMFKAVFRSPDISMIIGLIAGSFAIYASQRAATHYISLVGVTPRVPRLTLPPNLYDHIFLQRLFDTMQHTYETVSWYCSFGLNERWRRALVTRLDLRPGMRVGDLMSGAGELWPHLQPLVGTNGIITAVDFSPNMVTMARSRLRKSYTPITLLAEDSLCSSIPNGQLDAVVCCYGVKTLAAHEGPQFVAEVSRVLNDHGLFGIVEVSNPRHPLLGWPFRIYIRYVVPLVGRCFLADPLAYRMLAGYTEAFGNCRTLETQFAANGFEVHYFELLGGCASGLVGIKAATP